MSNCKYVGFSSAEVDRWVVIFPTFLKHSLMADAICKKFNATVVSAGFVDEFGQCYGSSSSLHKSANEGLDTICVSTLLKD